jgi:hypothetical protein
MTTPRMMEVILKSQCQKKEIKVQNIQHSERECCKNTARRGTSSLPSNGVRGPMVHCMVSLKTRTGNGQQEKLF